MRFEKGVSYYTRGIAYVTVSFPEDAVCCGYCSFCRPEPELKRFWCRLTNEMLINPFAPERGTRCPVVLEDKK